MSGYWTLVTAPSTEPVTLAEFKTHRRVTTSDEDTLMSQLIVAARQGLEAELGLALISQTWDWILDDWPATPARFPRSPVASITSVTYLDSAGASQTLAANQYRLTTGPPGRIVEAYGVTWPDLRDTTGTVTIRFAAGYGLAAAVPDALKVAILMLAGVLYENREAAQEPMVGNGLVEVPMAVRRLIDAYDPGVYV